MVSEDHYFHKVVVIPQGTYGYGKRGCTSRGWKFEGSISPSTALEVLAQVLYKYLNMDDDDFNLVHVGLMMVRLSAPKAAHDTYFPVSPSDEDDASDDSQDDDW